MSNSSSRYLGARLANGMELERFLGAGKFAWVYAAGGVGEPAAVKVLFRDDTQGERRFQREIKVMRELPPNANCVGYRGHGTLPDGAPWVAMELVDGFTLQSVLRSGRCIPERAACLLMAQICDGFRELHKLGLTHRDITPDNIMITHRGRQVKIMDFGLVQDSQGLLKLFEERDVLAGHDFSDDIDAGLIAGTPEYMAPEQITDPRRGARRTDTTADVYALGVVFYQLLTGRQLFPFAAGSGGHTGREGLAHYLNYRQAFHDEDLEPPANIDAELWSIVRKALGQDPSMRQRTASELADDIRFYLETGQGVLDDDLSETVSQVVDVARMRSAVMTAGDFEDIRALIDAPDIEHSRPGRLPPPSEVPTVEAPAPRSAPDLALMGEIHHPSRHAPRSPGVPTAFVVAMVLLLIAAAMLLIIALGT
ncbi:MAG: serine/threonine protein kinase [Deltaproteobacteria bacterium]|nr:MAG: serine/threonine protein kinase [Deltaproteobacteria bacterium]